MLFHKPDTSYKTLKSCWKRANKLAQDGTIDPKHPLAAAWSNCLLYCDAEDTRPMYLCESHAGYKQHMTSELAQTIVGLDWFAQKIDDYAINHLLTNDCSIAAMLYGWKQRMIFDPTMN